MKYRYTTCFALACFSFVCLESEGKDTNNPGAVLKKGLALDLDATKGVQRDASGRVLSWTNQVRTSPAQQFVPSPVGRKDPVRGIPTWLPADKAAGKFPAVQFRCQELVNAHEDAFDRLTQGSGHTWFCIMAVYDQTSRTPNTHAFFGNLRNTAAFGGKGTGGQFEGFWGVVHDDRRVYAGTRNGFDFKRNGKNNPEVLSKTVLEKNRLYLVAGRMGKGRGEVKVEVFVNSHIPENHAMTPVNPKGNPSKMAIGQERDATNHPGFESFDGEMYRLLIYGRPLGDAEFRRTVKYLMKHYGVTHHSRSGSGSPGTKKVSGTNGT